MRVVFDTNVAVAGIVGEGLCREILEIHLPEHEAILSQVLWDELLSTLRRKFGLAADDLPILALYRQHAQWPDPARLQMPSAVTLTTTGCWPRHWQGIPRRSSPATPIF